MWRPHFKIRSDEFNSPYPLFKKEGALLYFPPSSDEEGVRGRLISCMFNFKLILLLISAVASGWLLAWYETRKKYIQLLKNAHPISKGYFLGLNYLLNEQPDQAMEAFLKTFEMDNESLEIYLALGSLFRRRGELDRAVQIHQDLLRRPNLSVNQKSEVHLALARDYLAAGLLDRAEVALQELVDQGGEYRPIALDDLLNIYEQEQEWNKAIEVGEMLLKVGEPNWITALWRPKENPLNRARPSYTDAQIQCALSHYCCELAEQQSASGNVIQACRELNRALIYDKYSVRANSLLARLEQQQGNDKEAAKALKRIRPQDAGFLPEVALTNNQAYQCSQCGFKSHTLYWMCPGCKRWSTSQLL